MKVFVDLTGDRPLKKSDAIKLKHWWETHCLYDLRLEKRGRFWAVGGTKEK